MASYTQFICCCGASTISGVSRTEPERIVFDYLNSRKGSTRFDPITKRYIKVDGLNIKDAFLIWADPDRPTVSGSSGKLLCEYIVKHRLGSVTKTPLRHNPMHPARKPGKMDLRIWIWNINPVACQKWWDKHKPVEPPPKDVGVLKHAAVNVSRNAPVCPDNTTGTGPIDDDIPF